MFSIIPNYPTMCYAQADSRPPACRLDCYQRSFGLKNILHLRAMIQSQKVQRPETFNCTKIRPNKFLKRNEQLWKRLFENPSEWWDHRLDKANPRYPDFKHKKTQDALWIQNPYTPGWVSAKLSAMAPGEIQQSAFSQNVRLETYVKDGQHLKAIEYFQQMEAEGSSMDTFTYVSVLNACAHLRAVKEGRRIHAQIIRSICNSHIFVGNALIDMYAKCGSIIEAHRVFNNMVGRDVVSWNAMIMGCVKCEEGKKALELFLRMRQEGLEPNVGTYVAALNACASIAALEQGRLIHEQISQLGLDINPFMQSCLVDMYRKCGCIEDARKVFDKIASRDVIHWNAMISGCALHGLGKEALRLFDSMYKVGTQINSSTFVSLLTACNHAGLVDEGEYFLESMKAIYGVQTNVKHYSSLIDLHGRFGKLDWAEEMINKMWCQPDACVWISLLNACNVNGNIRLGERAAKQLLQLDPENTAAYVLLSNIYGTSGIWSKGKGSEEQNCICINSLTDSGSRETLSTPFH